MLGSETARWDTPTTGGSISNHAEDSIQHRTKGASSVAEALEPGPHGPTAWSNTIKVTREHLMRSVLVLYESGVSERDTQYCLQQMLGIRPALGWVSSQITQASQALDPTYGWCAKVFPIYGGVAPSRLVALSRTFRGS